ncbi:MAG TPA: radical SAM protein [Spirochaetota bacterium]|nr:radical SAM protein [Spirochaetota bacterium]OPZ36716.1 MAG: Radical SAM superfamily protein [Spirochaetes bacterium ADurb.BinA120]HNU92061.1 radical SAM protein [Spirochaetota bacterium]HPO45045.1 radical SAM protein [Spirochaetota bacterium]HPV98478.1 radical SAM protein [Spirochaetota bacterium]
MLVGKTGICNVFFGHCNLQCIYCQNFQISDNAIPCSMREPAEVVEEILGFMDENGVRALGFVSPSHVIPQMTGIIEAIRLVGKDYTVVMNTNAYDKKETIESLEGFVDVYLPDFKYADSDLALEYSGVRDYPVAGVRALREMFRQKGAGLHLRPDGTARSGLIIRHLVLPGHVENSKNCLRIIAEELSPSVHISLMSQYHPTPRVEGHARLGRTVSEEEFLEVVEELHRLGFRHGWIQEMGSDRLYLPDFRRENPFG